MVSASRTTERWRKQCWKQGCLDGVESRKLKQGEGQRGGHESVWQLGLTLRLYCCRGGARDVQFSGVQPGASVFAATDGERSFGRRASLLFRAWCGGEAGLARVGSGL